MPRGRQTAKRRVGRPSHLDELFPTPPSPCRLVHNASHVIALIDALQLAEDEEKFIVVEDGKSARRWRLPTFNRRGKVSAGAHSASPRAGPCTTRLMQLSFRISSCVAYHLLTTYVAKGGRFTFRIRCAVVSPDDIDDLWTKPAKMSRVVTRMRAASGKDAKPSPPTDVQQHEEHGAGSGELEQPADAPTEQQRHAGSKLRSALDPAAPDASPSAAASRQNSDEKPEPTVATPSRADALARESPTPRHPDGAHITGGDYRRARPVPRQSVSMPHGIGGSGGPQQGFDVNSRRLRPIKTAPPQRQANGDDDAAQVAF